MRSRFGLLVCLVVLGSTSVRAACVNKFTKRSEGGKQSITLLTGKLTFQAAQQLAAAIRERKADPVQWVDQAGKTIAKQFGELKVIRPMAVACDNNSSGVIMNVTFPSAVPPVRRMFVKFGASLTVEFDEQQ